MHDLNLGGQFTTILSNPNKYPIMKAWMMIFSMHYVIQQMIILKIRIILVLMPYVYNASATYLGLVNIKLKDPRVFVTAEPATALVAGRKSSNRFYAFVGANPGEDLGTMYLKGNSRSIFADKP